ncbi:hypothetical protein B0H17DRAFT_1063963 [Mycena rosella]|uniref:DUF6533 domain-containing protein n=1 Tax=Mycena rosella TaxID=1033263 RepID=A0AAD7DGV1_MYCRO|nr:hypothetical protein B0H17DRAFT_1063963 [Mycena rosella]
MSAIQIQSQLNSNYYFNLVSFSLLFYDYFLTLGWEVERYWGTPSTWPHILFLGNRYGTLLGNIPVVIQYFWTGNSTPKKISICRGLESYHQYFIIATQLMVGAMLILRTYALYERDRRVLAVLVSVAAGAVAVAIWSVFTGKTGDTQDNLHLYFGCNYGISHTQGVSLATAWAGVAGFDCLIFLLTLWKVLTRHRLHATNLLTVLLRDGSVYFLVMFMSNLSNIITFVFGTPYTRGIATTFTNIISSIMISRLMLNLRDPALSHMSGRRSQSTGTRITTGNIRFAPFWRPTTSGTVPELDTDATMTLDIELQDRAAHVNGAEPPHLV